MGFYRFRWFSEVFFVDFVCPRLYVSKKKCVKVNIETSAMMSMPYIDGVPDHVEVDHFAAVKINLTVVY